VFQKKKEKKEMYRLDTDTDLTIERSKGVKTKKIHPCIRQKIVKKKRQGKKRSLS
jgi:hypothetical protein